MRIQTQRGAELLEREIRELKSQLGICGDQVSKLSSFDLGSLQGQGASALVGRVHMQASVARAHLVFLQSLLDADTKNLSLVQALPTTSPGVLDTGVAQTRIDQAKCQRQELLWRRDEAMRVRRLRTSGNWAFDADESPYMADLPYDHLIAIQDQSIRDNERILARARDYERQAGSLYGSVDTSCVLAATASAREYAQTGDWGNVGWVEGALFLRKAQTESKLLGLGAEHGLVEQYVRGELSEEGSVWDWKTQGSWEGVDARVNADLLGYDASVVPHGKGKRSVGEDDQNAVFGVESTIGAHLAEGSASLESDWAQMKNTTVAATGSAGVVLGLQLLDQGTFSPSATAKAEAKASVLTSQTTARIGTSDFNCHAKAKGDAITATAEAGLTFGGEAVSAKVGAEAYAAIGEISGGITFLGVSVDTTLSAKVGGAGAKVGAVAEPTSVEGEVGAGLGIGLGAKVKVDWSGAYSSFANVTDAWGFWWNGLRG